MARCGRRRNYIAFTAIYCFSTEIGRKQRPTTGVLSRRRDSRALRGFELRAADRLSELQNAGFARP